MRKAQDEAAVSRERYEGGRPPAEAKEIVTERHRGGKERAE